MLYYRVHRVGGRDPVEDAHALERTRCRDIYITVFGVKKGPIEVFRTSGVSSCGPLFTYSSLRDDDTPEYIHTLSFTCFHITSVRL